MDTRTETFNVYSWGLCMASVCTNLSDDAATTQLNVDLPTGISSRWQIADEPFSNGDPNGQPCPDDATCRHILFEC